MEPNLSLYITVFFLWYIENPNPLFSHTHSFWYIVGLYYFNSNIVLFICCFQISNVRLNTMCLQSCKSYIWIWIKSVFPFIFFRDYFDIINTFLQTLTYILKCFPLPYMLLSYVSHLFTCLIFYSEKQEHHLWCETTIFHINWSNQSGAPYYVVC